MLHRSQYHLGFPLPGVMRKGKAAFGGSGRGLGYKQIVEAVSKYGGFEEVPAVWGGNKQTAQSPHNPECEPHASAYPDCTLSRMSRLHIDTESEELERVYCHREWSALVRALLAKATRLAFRFRLVRVHRDGGAGSRLCAQGHLSTGAPPVFPLLRRHGAAHAIQLAGFV